MPDEADDGQLDETKIAGSMLAGAASAVVSRICTHPMDTIKARLQMQGALEGDPVYRSTRHAFDNLARTEGVRGFYRGFGAIVGGFVPAQMAYFGGYEAGKELTQPLRSSGHGLAADMLTGVFQQSVAGVLFTPIDVIKERMQVQTMMGNKFKYDSTWHAVTSIIRQRGVRGMLKGYWATNAVWLPWNAIYIASYEKTKAVAAHYLSSDPLPMWAYALCSGSSAALAVVLTHPPDVVKTQLQVLAATNEAGDLTAMQVCRTILQKKGGRGFTAGLSARLATIVPGNALAWFTYELIKKRLDGQK